MANELKGTMVQAQNIGSNLNPSNIGNFQKVLRDISRNTYEKQAKTDSKSSAIAGAGVNASEVSGGTFASVMGALEQMRGGDISKEYAAGVQGYKDTLDALEKKRAAAVSATTSAQENMTKSLALIKGYQDAGLEVPPALYAAVGTKDPNNPLTPAEMGIQQVITNGTQKVAQGTWDGKADPDVYSKTREAYIKEGMGTKEDFDVKFSHLLDPDQTERWSQLGITYSEPVSITTKTAPGTTGSSTIDTTKQGYSTTPMQQAGGLTQASIDQAAWQYALTGTMPSIGLGSTGQASAKRSAIQNRAAELDSTGSIASNKAMLTALTSTLTENTKYSSTMNRSIGIVDENLKMLADGASKVNNYNSPLVNEWTNLAKTKVIGDGDLNSYQTALQTVRTEYSQILSRGGQVTDSVRDEAKKLIPDNINKTQLQMVLNTLRTEGENVRNGANQQLADTQDKINNILGGKVITKSNLYNTSVKISDPNEWLKSLNTPVIDDYLTKKGF